MRDLRQASRQPDSARRVRSALGVFQKYADFDGFVHLTLYDHWNSLTALQIREFSTAFKAVLIRRITDQGRVMKRSAVVDWLVLGHQRVGDYDKTTVRVRTSKGDSVLSFFWTCNTQCRISDIELSGASLAVNYQGQFNKIIRDHGFDELLRRMQN